MVNIWMVLQLTRVLLWRMQYLPILGQMFLPCRINLNTLMTTLNGVHPEAVFEYAIDQAAKSITLRQRDGGEILLGGFVTASTHKDLTAALVTPSGQGTNQTL